MASTIRTDKIGPVSGSVDLTLPTSDGSAKSALITDGSKALSFATGTPSASNFLRGDGTWAAVAGGLSTASQWRLTADFTGDVAPIATNLEEADTYGAGTLGSSMTQSSGIFTFPSTGYWLVRFHADFKAGVAHGSLYNEVELRTTLDNGATLYNSAALTSVGLTAANHWSGAETELIFDVTDTTLCKCRFDINVEQVDVITKGNTGKNETFFTFIKLADT